MPFPRTYNPVVTPSATPLVAVTTQEAVTYSDIQQSQGNVIYKADSVYYKAGTIAQLAQPMEIQSYDINGNIQITQKQIVIDPFQHEPSSIISFCNDDVIFDGNERLDLPLTVDGTANLLFNVQQLKPSTSLPADPFIMPQFGDKYGFMDGYNDDIE